MTSRIEKLLDEINELPEQERQLLMQRLLEHIGEARPVYAVRDVEARYEPGRHTPSSKSIDMTSVTLVLPDELAKQAREAGLLAGKSMEDLLRRALQERTKAEPLAPNQRRRLVRENGYLVVEALPGEKPITTEEVRNLLDDMEW